MKSVIIHSEATKELDNAIKYYEKQKIGLGLDLLSEIEQTIEKIKTQQSAVSSQQVFEMGILPHLKKIPPL